MCVRNKIRIGLKHPPCMIAMENVYHALRIMQCDPVLELQIFFEGRSTVPYTATYDATSGQYRLDHRLDDRASCLLRVEDCTTIHDVMSWLLKRNPTHVRLHKIVTYKDESFQYSNPCNIPIWGLM